MKTPNTKKKFTAFAAVLTLLLLDSAMVQATPLSEAPLGQSNRTTSTVSSEHGLVIDYAQVDQKDDKQEPKPEPQVQPLADGTYEVVARHSGKALDVKDWDNSNGARVGQWSSTGGENQRWTITHLGNNRYKIIGLSGKALGVSEASKTNGATVIMWTPDGKANQEWTIAPTSDGYYSVRAVHSGQALQIEGASADDGALSIQWPYTGANNQQWLFQKP